MSDFKKEVQFVEICFLNDSKKFGKAVCDLLGLSKTKIKSFKYMKKKMELKVDKTLSYRLPLDLVNYGRINGVYNGETPNLIYEDKTFLVLSKPANVHVHPLSYSETDNILSYLRSRPELSQYLSINSNSYDRGLLYRLDYSTSGCLIYIKREEEYKFLRENFNEIAKEKEYYAVVHGEFLGDMDYEDYLLSSESKGKKIKVGSALDGRKANISVSLLEYNNKNNVSLVKIKLKQGHRHQIRIQLSHAGFPILGDSLYGEDNVDKLHLHCHQYKLEFRGELRVFKDSHFKSLFDFSCLNSKL